MKKFVRLTSGIEVPEASLMKNANEIYKSFNNTRSGWTDMLIRLSLASEYNFNPRITDRLIRPHEAKIMQDSIYRFYIGPLLDRCKQEPMAKTALVACMIEASQWEDEFEGNLCEPLASGREILPTLFKNNVTNQQKAS